MFSAKRALVAGVVVIVGALLSAPPAYAQASGSTDIDITLPDIVVLHYWSNIDINVPKAALAALLTGGTGDTGEDEGTANGGSAINVALSGGNLAANTSVSTTMSGTGDPSAVVMVLNNAWAVRSISLAGGTSTKLEIATTDTKLDHQTTTATIGVSGLKVDDGTSSGTSITFTAPGLVNPKIGAVQMTLDLTNATNAGAYLDFVFTLTATNI